MNKIAFLCRDVGRLPTATAGLGLGLASLGWTLDNALSLGGTAQMTGSVLASLLFLPVISKFLLYPAILRQELAHPVASSILPTLPMGLMIVSVTLGLYFPVAGEVLWFLAVVAHFLLLADFIWRHLRSLKVSSVMPSWFIPPVGILTAVLTVPDTFFTSLAYFIMIFGMVSFALLLPLIVYRLIFYPAIADAAKPTIAILAAPASLALASYINLISNPSFWLVLTLLALALVLTFFTYLILIRLLRLPFSPAFAAFTFPLVISASAIYRVTKLFAFHPGTRAYAETLYYLGATELFIATIVVIYVSFLYIRAYLRACKQV